MDIQQYKITKDGTDLFFVDRALTSARTEVKRFLARNGFDDTVVYIRNNRHFGSLWLPINTDAL